MGVPARVRLVYSSVESMTPAAGRWLAEMFDSTGDSSTLPLIVVSVADKARRAGVVRPKRWQLLAFRGGGEGGSSCTPPYWTEISMAASGSCSIQRDSRLEAGAKVGLDGWFATGPG
jgi:hypothetical protein